MNMMKASKTLRPNSNLLRIQTNEDVKSEMSKASKSDARLQLEKEM